MPLASGTKLGPYEIQSLLGAGGMGEVYRALDRRLDRTVAIKVLASHLSASPELKQRMDREARAISALNHPHICQLYDIGSQDGTDYLVIEFLEGETLADRLRKSAMPLAEILKIGIAVAEALATAHRQGIMHRDLKPGNIMLTPGGAKLMDFGLAKPLGMQPAGTVSGAAPSFTAAPTVSGPGPSPFSPLTSAGSVVGTIQYMSPEQIEGKEADARSDIFAFGAVLYEMAAGKRPFGGKSQISLASSILESEPELLGALKPDTPPALEHVVNVCLAKNPEERFQTANDVKLELQWIASGKSAAAVTAAGPAAAPGTQRRERLAWIAALVAAAALGLAGGAYLLRPNHQVRPIRTVINPPEKTTLNLTGDAAGPPVLSPDETSIAFTATGEEGKTLLWARPLDSVDAHSLPGTEGASFPFWSPDSRSLAFFSGGKLKTVELSGGAPQVVTDAPLGRGGAWGPGGIILFSPDASSAMFRVSTAGGAPVAITTLNAAEYTSHRWPYMLPDGRHYVYLAMNHDASKSANDAIFFGSIDGRENRQLLHSESNAIYAGGYLLFARGDQLMAQKFDPGNGNLSGEAQRVAKGILNDFTTWHMDASASGEGLLVFCSGNGSGGNLQLVWLDRSGKQIGVAADNLTNLAIARLSPRGDRVAAELDIGVADIWVLDLARGVRTRLTFGTNLNLSPVWSPDGNWIAYTSVRAGRSHLVRRRADGSGAEEELATEEQPTLFTDWSRDGKYLFFWHTNGDQAGAWALPLEGERKAQRVLEHGAVPVLSPDGHWLAYSSAESGAIEIYVTGFAGAQGKWQVSDKGGYTAQWSADGKQLYYMDLAYNLYFVPVTYSGSALQFGAPQTMVVNWSAPNVFFDVSPDGKKILLDKAPQQVSSAITVVTNFTAELKK